MTIGMIVLPLELLLDTGPRLTEGVIFSPLCSLMKPP